MPDFPQDLIRHKVGTIQIQCGEQSAEIQLSSLDIIIDRYHLIKSLLIAAKDAGVEVVTGGEFVGFNTSGHRTELIIRMNGEDTKITTKYLIGADGVNSQVRSHAGLKDIDQVPLLQAEIQLPKNWDADITKVWFDPDKTPYFYWLIPDQDNKAVVGLISSRGNNIRQLLEEFLKNNSFEPLGYQTGLAAMYSRSSDHEIMVGNVRVLMVGDAAGHVKVTTVGGTVTGFGGAKAAVGAILDGQSYQTTLHCVSKELNIHQLIRQMLDNMTGRDYQKLIEYISPAVKTFLRRYNRDEMGRHFWKLVFLQPRFIPLGLKLLSRVIISKMDSKVIAHSE
jgi:flavin-dependent dehydrogenase